MPDESDPPRKYYDFKHREFERANKSKRGPDPLPEVDGLAESAYDPTDPIDVRELCQQAQAPGPTLARDPLPTEQNDVHGILRENLARENAAGLNNVPVAKRKLSKRTRDYWFLIVFGNIVMTLIAVNAYRAGNAVVFVYMMAGLGLYNAAVTWVMWAVMDRY